MPFTSARPAPVQAQQAPTTPSQAAPMPQQGYAPPPAPAPASYQAQPGVGDSRAPAQGFRGGFGNRPAISAPRPLVQRSPFAGIETAEVSQRNPFLEAGSYILKILSMVYKEPTRTGGYTGIIIEVEVVTSSFDPQNCPQSNQEGTRASIFMKQNDSMASNFKGLLIAAAGFDKDGNPRPVSDVVTTEEAEAAVGPEQPYSGALVFDVANSSPTRAGGTFTYHNFHPVALNADGTIDEAKTCGGLS